jgi:hypothetical protein
MERPIQGSLTKLFLLLVSKALSHFSEFLALARASDPPLLHSVALYSILQELRNVASFVLIVEAVVFYP